MRVKIVTQPTTMMVIAVMVVTMTTSPIRVNLFGIIYYFIFSWIFFVSHTNDLKKMREIQFLNKVFPESDMSKLTWCTSFSFPSSINFWLRMSLAIKSILLQILINWVSSCQTTCQFFFLTRANVFNSSKLKIWSRKCSICQLNESCAFGSSLPRAFDNLSARSAHERISIAQKSQMHLFFFSFFLIFLLLLKYLSF